MLADAPSQAARPASSAGDQQPATATASRPPSHGRRRQRPGEQVVESARGLLAPGRRELAGGHEGEQDGEDQEADPEARPRRRCRCAPSRGSTSWTEEPVMVAPADRATRP